MKKIILRFIPLLLLAACTQTQNKSSNTETTAASDSNGIGSRYGLLANLPLREGYPSEAGIKELQDELLFQRATQAYLWALPAINMYGMKEGSEKDFGKGYNILPIWKERLNAKTLITTPNSDVIYALGYLDLKEDGPIVIDAPPGLQGILDDFWQRPIQSVGLIDGRKWRGDVGLPGPDKGKGGKYLILPPDYKGKIPTGYYVYRSGTYGVFVFWRGFFKDPKDLKPPVEVMEKTVIYPLGKKDQAKPMQFPDGSTGPHNMLYPSDGSAFEMLSRFIDHEYVDTADMEMRGILQSIGIEKGKPFNPDAHTKDILDKAARTAYKMGKMIGFDLINYVPDTKYYSDKQWLNGFPVNETFTAGTYNYINPRTSFFAAAYSASPVMALNVENMGSKYPSAFRDADGNFFSGSHSYVLHLPKNVPALLFWSVTLYDAETAAGLDNGQPFPSINSMDKPAMNADSTYDFYFGPDSPGEGKNWIRTVPDKGFFVNIRLYGPKKSFFDHSWIPDDVKKIK
ncbi:MAG TPA: DUF1254 domain-containing protein [Puia sp.]|nr:DUF1254 domain-containing protein [Puia sp.]